MVTVQAPLDRIPILVQAGAIIPLIASETETLAQDLAGDRYQTLDDRLILKVFPAVATTKKSFKLYDATLTEADQEKGRIQVRVTASPIVRRYEIVLPGSSKPQSILMGNELLREGRKPGPSEWSPQWWSDATDRTVHVRFTKKDFELIVNRR